MRKLTIDMFYKHVKRQKGQIGQKKIPNVSILLHRHTIQILFPAPDMLGNIWKIFSTTK